MGTFAKDKSKTVEFEDLSEVVHIIRRRLWSLPLVLDISTLGSVVILGSLFPRTGITVNFLRRKFKG